MVVKYKKYAGIFLSLFILLVPTFAVHAEFDGFPVVIVPGMLASFDKKLMYQDKEDNKWGFVPFGNVYKALIKELENNGYEEGKTLFIAYYDWRKPVSENWSKYLKPKIDEAKQKSGRDRVDLVAHSMGGLLSRAYIQSDSYGYDVNKLVMMGTPNYGASEAYVVWEGGLYPQSWTPPLKLFISSIEWQLKKSKDKQDQNRPSTIREFFPSIKDLLPTAPFVKNGDGLMKLSDMEDENDFLIDLNNNVGLLKERVQAWNGVKTYSGVTGKTMAEISLGDKSQNDESSKRWRDGHPNPDPPTANSDQGDETVLLASSTIPDITKETLNGTSHSKIPDDARSYIAWFLNPPFQSKSSLFQQFFAGFFSNMTAYAQEDSELYVEPNSMLSFTVSPNVDFEVIDPDGKILSRDKNEIGDDAYFDDDPEDDTDIVLVVIRNPKTGKYVLKLNGKSSGDYYVDSTFVDENGNFEDSNDGKITQEEEITLDATVSETEGVTLPSGDDKEKSDEQGTENKKEISVGPNTAVEKSNKKVGSVLGATTVRTKLSDTVVSVQNKLAVLLGNKKANEPKITKAVYQALMGPLNDMLVRVRAYEKPTQALPYQGGVLLEKAKLDYRDFANKVDMLIATGKLNKQTTDVLVALKQRLEKAGMK